MKHKFWFILGILILLLSAAGGYLWANGLMDALMEFRSPLAIHPPTPGEALGDPLTGRVVIILVDALRLDTALKPAVMPFLETLRQGGAWATMYSQPPSYSAPGWTTILTGAWPELNDSQLINPPDNEHVRAFTQDNIFAAAERAGLLAAVSGYTWFEGMLANAGVDAGFYTPGEDHAADLEVVAAARPWLQDPAYPLVLIHLDQVDYAGHHEGGPRDPRWDAAASRVDAMIQEIVSLVDLEKDTVIVLSDHGQINQGGHGGQDAITLVGPFVMIGKGVLPGRYADMQMVDVAPTVAALLGTSLPAASQGWVLTEMLALSAEQAERIDQALLVQKKGLLANYQATTGAQLPPNTPLETARDYQEAMGLAKALRLVKQRLPRGIFALVAALVPAAILYRWGGKRAGWLVGGAILYALVFNLVYALVAQKTYSLSSVVSADNLIFTTAGYAALSLLAAWLATLLWLRAFRRSPAEAAWTTLGLVLVTLYVLALPVLWNIYRNGALVRWTLPEFGSMFLAFLSILQILFVSVTGLLLTGVAGLVAWVVGRAVSARNNSA